MQRYCTIFENIRSESWRREKLTALIHYFITAAIKKGLPIMADDITPIKSIYIGDNKKVELIKEKLLEKGFFVAGIRPPTVPVGTARIRISINVFMLKIK